MKKEWKKGWKVIRKYSRKSCSNISSRVVYHKNKITKRPEKCGPLAVFKTREKARVFIKNPSIQVRCKIVKCLYTKSIDRCLWNAHSKICHLPTGNVLADEVKCLE